MPGVRYEGAPSDSELCRRFGLDCPCLEAIKQIHEICKARWAMYRAAFGKRFSQVMDERDWGKEKAGQVFGVSPTMIQKYLEGQNFPEAEALFRMADILDVSVDWLGGRTDTREVAGAAKKPPSHK